jgi:hypothetical protein
VLNAVRLSHKARDHLHKVWQYRKGKDLGIFLVICGGLAIVGGIFGKDFYKADILALGAFKEKSSRWSGRLVFIVGGVVLIAIGIRLIVDAE